MKKKEIILISIIIILIISLIGTIIYYNKNEKITIEAEVLATGSNYLLVTATNNEDYVVNTSESNKYQIGDKLKLELTNINKKKTPYEATTKNIILIETQKDNQVSEEQNGNIIENTDNNNITSNEVTTNQESNNSNNNNENKEITNSNNTNNQTKEENYTEEQVITYFENLNNELSSYNNEQTLGETIKTNFVKCIDFLFYNEPIGGKTFSELTNSAKIKILEISLSIDSKIDSKFPGYKESINSKYQNIKSKVVEKYLDTTTTICTNDPNLCITAKEGFQDLKNNFGLTWDVIKNLVGTGTSKLKDWYEIWRYN